MSTRKRPDEKTLALLRRSGSDNREEAFQAQAELAKALELPLRQGVLVGDIARDIYEVDMLEPDATPEYPLDIIAPGEEDEHVAYTQPGVGYIPQRQVAGDWLMVPTFTQADSIDWPLSVARHARYNLVARALETLEAGFVKKTNDDGWHVLLAAAVDRNILVFDADAQAGQFTKRLLSLMKVVMVRNGGGNTASIRRSRLTDFYFSHEGMEDIRNWNVDQIDEITRREIFLASDEGSAVSRIFGVNLHPLDEFGESQQYQDFFTTDLGGSLASGDVELGIGLDLSANDSFYMPVKQEVSIFEDPNLHRWQKAGYYGWTELGFACLDQRRVLAASF